MRMQLVLVLTAAIALPSPVLHRPAPPAKQPPSKYVRVEQHGNVWWLISPDGRPFYSTSGEQFRALELGALQQFLEARYGGSVDSLNKAWGGERFTSFEEAADRKLDPAITFGAMYDDHQAFRREILNVAVVKILTTDRAAALRIVQTEHEKTRPVLVTEWAVPADAAQAAQIAADLYNLPYVVGAHPSGTPSQEVQEALDAITKRMAH